MEIVLAVATVLGGIAAIWFFVDKASEARWRRPRILSSRGKTVPANITNLDFPREVIEAVEKLLPGWRLPRVDDLTGDWALFFDPGSLSPLLCEGDFFGSGEPAYALFVLGSGQVRYKVVVLTRTAQRITDVYHLTEGSGPFYNMYVFPVAPGTYKVGRSVWKYGGPRTLVLELEGINVGTYESASCIYFWNSVARCFFHQWMTD